jgi:5-methylcytosine-specific restriction endonuclease McrA
VTSTASLVCSSRAMPVSEITACRLNNQKGKDNSRELTCRFILGKSFCIVFHTISQSTSK